MLFQELHKTIRDLNSDVKNVANCEKAKKLRSKLLRIGLPMAIIGFGGAFACFVLFATGGIGAIGPGGPTARILVPFFLLIPCFLVGGIGATIAGLGFKIVVTGYTSQIVEEAVGNTCPQCGASLASDDKFCAQCGYQMRVVCPDCGTTNDASDHFCSQCGKRLS